MTTKTQRSRLPRKTRPALRPRPAQSSQRRRPPPLVVAALVALAAAGLLAAVVSMAGGNSGTSTAQFDSQAAIAEGPALAPLQDTGDDAAIGKQAPMIEGIDRAGDAVTLPTTGKPTIVLFVAHWCPHCQRELPLVQKWIDEGSMPDDVDLVAVATGIDKTRPNYPPSAWFDREDWTPRTVADATGAAAKAYGLTSFPYWVAVDATGTIVDRQSGELTLDQVTAMASLATG